MEFQNYRGASIGLKQCNMKKAKELETAIINGKFPIMIYGPSGSGKTETVKYVLTRLKLKFLYVDLAETVIRKPFIRHAVVFTHIYHVSDLNKVLYKERTIIESNLAYLNKIEGYTLLKFNTSNKIDSFDRLKSIDSYVSLSKLMKEQQLLHRLELYRFIGRIFYGKLRTGAVVIDDEFIYVELCSKDDKTVVKRVDFECEPAIELCSSVQNTRNQIILNKGDLIKRHRINFVDSSEETVDYPLESLVQSVSDECSFNSDFLFQMSDSNELIVLNETIPRILIDNIELRMNKEEHIVRFNRNKIRGYLYENMLAFSTIDSLPLLYDYFSLTDLSSDFTIALLGAVSRNGKAPKQGCKFKPLSQTHYSLI
ncbi:hypothetical protein PAEPH01_1441 [Pancytospora epiphaga]|nr:hypothetical protein PAEPH01_1441 [Pancytospora epiphaga]